MAVPTSGLSKTLQTLTLTKIGEIDKQRKKYENKKLEDLTKVESHKDQRERVSCLLAGVKATIPGAPTDQSLSNIRRCLDQSRFDGSIPLEMLGSFEEQLRKKLDDQSCKLGLANLYSQLMTEWMNPASPVPEQPTEEESEKLDDSFEILERQKERLQELCDKFESVVFEPLETDEVEIDLYIQELFAGDEGIKALRDLREKVKNHSEYMLANSTPFDETSLTWCIKGLLAEDLLSEEKQNVLRDFLDNKLVLSETADVLNMRYGDLESWTWDAEEGIPVMPRQQLNGKYRIWMDEDVLQAIFIHYIGISWCVSLKRSLTELVKSGSVWTWKQGSPMPQEAVARRTYCLARSQSHLPVPCEIGRDVK